MVWLYIESVTIGTKIKSGLETNAHGFSCVMGWLSVRQPLINLGVVLLLAIHSGLVMLIK